MIIIPTQFQKKDFPHVMIFYRWLELIKHVHACPQTKLTKALIWKYDCHHATHSPPTIIKVCFALAFKLNWLITRPGDQAWFGVSFT